MYKLKLHIFPLIQVSSFIASIYFLESNILMSALFLCIAALFLNFSLHITIHHFVHFRLRSRTLNAVLEFAYTLLLALPYSFYRMQHLNHHRFDNQIGDMTSTWEKKDDKIIPRSFFKYSFLWFLSGSLKGAIEKANKSGDINPREIKKIRYQFLVLLVVYSLLALLNPWYVLFYATLFYLGWCFIAITNYGQHLPIKYNSTVAYTFTNRLYNFLFFNNGLHLEHHLDPQLDYHELDLKDKSKVSWPHFIIAFFKLK